MVRERVLRKDEYLFHDEMKVNQLFILCAGSLRLEKEVDVLRENFWPGIKQGWESNAVVKRVVYKIRDLQD